MKTTSESCVYAVVALWVAVLIGSAYLLKGTVYADPVKESLSTITVMAFVMFTVTKKGVGG